MAEEGEQHSGLRWTQTAT